MSGDRLYSSHTDVRAMNSAYLELARDRISRAEVFAFCTRLWLALLALTILLAVPAFAFIKSHPLVSATFSLAAVGVAGAAIGVLLVQGRFR